MRSEPPADRMMDALGATDLTPMERIVFAAIAYHDGPGGARPSAGKLALKLQISRGAVFAYIKALERKGRLKRRRGKHANHYDLSYARPQCREIPDSENRRHSVGKSGATVSGDSRPEGNEGNLSAPTAQREIPDSESVSASATARGAAPGGAPRADACERERPPSEPHDPGPQPSDHHVLHDCVGPCGTQRWAIPGAVMGSECRPCGTWKAHWPAEEATGSAREPDERARAYG